MDWLPSILSERLAASQRLTGTPVPAAAAPFLQSWCDPSRPLPDLLLLLAGTRTAETNGISAAGCTPEARRTTALADAELLLNGPSVAPRWPLPPLPAGVSPALISWVMCDQLGLHPQVAALGLSLPPPFAHLRCEPPEFGPADCVSTGHAMELERVRQLLQRGHRLGSRLRHPLLLAECVPGGTTTALAVLTGLGLPVDTLVSGSALHPPMTLKQTLVRQGLASCSTGSAVDIGVLLAAVGDPFQAFATGLLLGVVEADQPVLLAGGSQMAAVLALALQALPPSARQGLSNQVLLGTTAWLAAECLQASAGPSSLMVLLRNLEQHFSVSLQAYAAGLRFSNSQQPRLRDFEQGHVKEGVGAGGLTLLAQWRGLPLSRLGIACDRAVDQLLAHGHHNRAAP
ncbi:MAG: nicotinate-nucleotide--dimethylbenzimidazole phosphoribosyltransferase [Cyanobacteriota bacterium]|nr:nicotinate-nucleotide--dimethylbenzimidazole phosphoribosyltransferase [Cyanobacteriota bacterium]